MKTNYHLKFKATGIKSDTILYKLFRQHNGIDWVPAYESDLCKMNSQKEHAFALGKFSATKMIQKERLSVGCLSGSVKIIIEEDADGRRQVLYEILTSMPELLNSKPTFILSKAENISFCTEVAQKVATPSFLDFILNGIEISMIIGVDFTLSNKFISDPESLHNISHLKRNEYLGAIITVGKILENYDTDKKIPVFGFGAKIPGILDRRGSNCFALNGDIFNPEVNGIEEIVKLYKKNVGKLKFSGPTHFSEIINYANNMIEYEQKAYK